MVDTGTPTVALLDEAIRLHRNGALAEAVARYHHILRLDVANTDAHYYLAIAAQQQGDIEQAFDRVRELLAIDSRHARGHKLLGLLLSRRGKRQEALESYDRSIACQADMAEVHGARADVLAELGRLAEAVTSYDRALAIQPASIGDWCNRGAVLNDLERYEEAIASYSRALALRSDFPEALFNRGNVLVRLGRYDEALANYDKALALRPDYADALNNRGNALLKLARLEEAAASLNAALAIDPRHFDALLASSTAFLRLGNPSEALIRCDRALEINGQAVDALVNRATALHTLNRYQDALSTLQRVLAINPGDPGTSLKVSLLCLLLGRLDEGWSLYEFRWQVTGAVPRSYRQPNWTGELVRGALLVWGEQGLGDQIIYAGMVQDLVGKADEIVLEAEPRLAPLFARSFPGIKVVAQLPEPELYGGRVDAHIALGSLGQYLRPNIGAIPRRANGYLVADAGRRRALRARLADDGRKVIGLSWLSFTHNGFLKSAQLRDLEAMLRVPGCRFIDLQYGDTRGEREVVEQELGYRIERLPDIDTTLDIDGLAALIAACDAVVTIGNVTAHLSGAIGTPTWVIVPQGLARIWYWFNDGNNSLWYPRVRVLRQDVGQPWRELFATAALEVEALVHRG